MEPRPTRVIAKDQVDVWLARLLAESQVIAPTTSEFGDEVFAPVSSPAEVLWRFSNPLHPPKQFLLPQTEPLVAIRRDGDGWQVRAVADERPRVLFNLRPCDAAGLAFLRRVHEVEPPDTAVLRRAAALTVVCLACPEPCPQGFCICSGAGPFAAESFDIQLVDLGDALLAEAGSERGAAMLVAAGPLFRPATPVETQLRTELEERAKRSFGEETCHFASAMRRVSTGRVEDALWSAMADWCLECGACNFLCPTCYCFSVGDRCEDGGYLRCRTWDSCQYAAFTREASGHNPRAAHGDRVRRRFFHKVSAQYFQRDGAVGCVGCGRCVEACLGTTDMPAVVAALRQGVWRG
jgi:formate hydrogenlyase subunit 6/NADH:ubiquinone oxidoreductase subunit I